MQANYRRNYASAADLREMMTGPGVSCFRPDSARRCSRLRARSRAFERIWGVAEPTRAVPAPRESPRLRRLMCSEVIVMRLWWCGVNMTRLPLSASAGQDTPGSLGCEGRRCRDIGPIARSRRVRGRRDPFAREKTIATRWERWMLRMVWRRCVVGDAAGWTRPVRQRRQYRHDHRGGSRSRCVDGKIRCSCNVAGGGVVEELVQTCLGWTCLTAVVGHSDCHWAVL
jgi:hypothetical protein